MIVAPVRAWLHYVHQGLLAIWNVVAYSDFKYVTWAVLYGVYCYWVWSS